jgi:hypothetical protein
MSERYEQLTLPEVDRALIYQGLLAGLAIEACVAEGAV